MTATPPNIASQIETIRRRIASDPNNAGLQVEAREAVQRFAQHLERALAWLRQGLLHEASAYSDDCGNLARCLIDMLADETFIAAIPETQSLPTRTHIEPLIMAPVDAGRDESLIDTWIAENVLCLSMETRLASLQALRHAQPREQRWTTLATPFVDTAIESIQDEVDSVVASGDGQAMQSMQRRLAAMGIASSNNGARAVHRLERAWNARQDAEAKKTAAQTSMAMHLAWAAMDVNTAQQLRAQWQSIVELGEVDSAAMSVANPVEQWLDGLAGRITRRRHESTLVDELERSLDEERHVADLERQYAALQRQDIAVPPRVATRLGLRLAEHRSARRRRWTVAMAVVAGMAAILIVAIVVTGEARRREFRASLVEQTVAHQLEDDDPNGALRTLEDALDKGTIDSETARPIAARIKQERASWANRFNIAKAHHDRAIELLGQENSESMIVQAEHALRDAAAALPRGEDLDLTDTQERLRLRRVAWTAAQREVLRPRLTAIDTVIATPLPDSNDTVAWTTRREAMATALAQLASISSEPIAAESDLQSQLQRRRIVLTRLHAEAAEQLRLLQQLEQLMLALQRIPASEQAWAAIWEALLAEHSTQLSHMRPLKDWNDGLHDAQAGTAVQHWREHVYPELLVAGLIGDSPPAGDLGIVADRLRDHLELTQNTDSPYATIARKLLEQSGDENSSERAAQTLSNAMLEDLYRVPLSSGGVLYRRSNLNASTPLAHAIGSTSDLPLGPTELSPADLPDGVGPQGSLTRVGSSDLISKAIDAMATGAPAAKTLLGLLEELEQEDDPDGIVNPLARLATLEAIQQFIGTGESASALNQWLALAKRTDSPLLRNWPKLSMEGTRQSRRELIRELQRKLAGAPTPQALRVAMAAPALDVQAKTSPAAPAAVLLYKNGVWTVLGTLPQRAFVLQATPGRESRFVPLGVDADGTVNPPPDCLVLPTLIFERK